MRKLDHGPAAPKIARPSIHPNPSSRFRRTSIAPPTDDSQITQHRIPTLKSDRLLVPIFDVFASPGGSSEVISLFCGHVDSRGAGGVRGLINEGENIRVFVEPADDAFDRLKGDKVHNAMLVTALLWLAQHREALRQTWLA